MGPEAVAASGASAVPLVLAGFVLVYLLELALVHVCAEPGPQPAGAAVGDGHEHGAPGHVHVHAEATGCSVQTMGLAAFVGMSLHTIGDGFMLATARTKAGLALLVFLASTRSRTRSRSPPSSARRTTHGRARSR